MRWLTRPQLLRLLNVLERLGLYIVCLVRSHAFESNEHSTNFPRLMIEAFIRLPEQYEFRKDMHTLGQIRDHQGGKVLCDMNS